MDKARKKNIKRIISLVCVAILVVLLAAMPLIAKQNPEADGPQASILSHTASIGSIQTALIGGGTLAEDDAVTVSVPAAVKLKEFLVSNGDHVDEGTPIASVDRVTVMKAITQVQETLDYLSGQIEDANDTSTTENLTALAGGTVKILYAKKGDSVQDVMLEHGALAVLSLDGIMAVDLESQSALASGTAVKVTFSDGTTANGKIVRNLSGSMTVTVEDDDYTVDDTVQVTAEDGTVLGSGALYIYNPWNATAYAGTVYSVNVSVGDQLKAGKTLMKLSDVGYSATYRRLISQRQEYEDLMMDLFKMYQTETVTAPESGTVSGIDKDSAQLLASSDSGLTAKLLSFLGIGSRDGYIAHAARVTDVTDQGMTLLVNPQQNKLTDFAALSSLSTEIPDKSFSWNYDGEPAVYTQDENGLLRKDGKAKVGDTIFVVGDDDEIFWFVKAAHDRTDVNSLSEEEPCTDTYLAVLSDSDPDPDPEPDPNPPATEPPATEPPATEPPATEPPATEPPATEPPATEPPATEPPATEPPATEPPATEPPATEPPATEPPATEPVTYYGYVAQVVAIENDTMKVKQIKNPLDISDPSNPPSVTVDPTALTEEETYTGSLVAASTVAKDDYLLLITEKDGTLKRIVRLQAPASGQTPGGSMPGGGGRPSGGNWGSMAGMGSIGGNYQQKSTFELYGLEMADIAAVTPQNTITLEIAIDELDIGKLQPGMSAQVKINALGGEKHTAVITEIGNTGTSNGGSSKYTVELTMERTGDMLAGMNATATIVLSTVDNVLTVPAAALVEQGNETVVYTGYNEKEETLLNPVVVKVGASDGESVQILEGLKAGDVCYYAYYDTLEVSFTPDFGGFSF